MNFETALAHARALRAGADRRRWAAGALVAAVFLAWVAWRHEDPVRSAAVLIFGALAVAALVTRRPGEHALEALAGQQVRWWAPSPSHGLIALHQQQLCLGPLAFSMDRHERRRVSTVAYDEATHALVVRTVELERRRTAEREVQRRHDVTLDQHTTPARGYELAKAFLDAQR